MAEIVIYTTRFCPYCIRAKSFLASRGLAFREIAVDGNAELRAKVMADSGQHTVPQIWIGAQHVGGCDDLLALARRDQLAPLLLQQGIIEECVNP